MKGCDAKNSFVFGTFHSDSPDLAPIIEHAQTYLAQSEVLALEVKASLNSALKARQLMMLPKSVSMQQVVGNELFEKVVDQLGPIVNMTRSQIQRFQPWAVAVMSQYPPAEGDNVVVDARLQLIASQLGKQVIGLETVESQFTVFTNMTPKMQLDFVKSTLQELSQLNDMLSNLKTFYLARDIRTIEQFARTVFDRQAQDYPELARYLETTLIDKRNRHMVEGMLPKLEEGIFVAVGALHLPGDEGILSLLEAHGYQIHPIP